MPARLLAALVVTAAASAGVDEAGPAARAAESSGGLHVVSQIRGPDGPWDYAAYDRDSSRLLVARGDGVMAVETPSGRVVPTLVPGQRVHGIVPLPGGRALSTNGEANTATLFETATGRVLATIPTGQKPDAAVRDPGSGLILVMNGRSGDITLIDAEKQVATGSIPVGGDLEMVAVDGRGVAYVNIEDRNEVAVVDLPGRRVVRRIPLPGCDGPTGLAYDADDALLVSACGNGVAKVMDAATGAERASLAIGPRPDGALYDPKRKLAYVPSGGDGTLAVIRLAPAPSVVTRVPTAKGARTAALDPETGRIYLRVADTVAAGAGERPKPVPGSFRILVVAPD